MKTKLTFKFYSCLFIFIILLDSILPSFVFAEDSATLNIGSPVALLMDMTTGKILYEKNPKERRSPASLTKVMTAIIVLENCELTDVATVSYDSVMSLSSGYVTANLQVGEELTIEQLLYVLMVGSSNDAAIVLAEHVSGSVESFSELMNQKAIELGCLDTNFVNPNGVHDENHYSTAYDLAIISQYAMKNETFRKLVSTTSYKLPITNKYETEDRLFTTTNELLIVNNNNRTDNYYYKYATGIKTGFTTPAGNCLIASTSRDGLEFISIVMGAGQTEDGYSQRYLDTISLLDYGYETYTIKQVYDKGSIAQTTKVKKATRETKRLDLILEKNITVLIKKENSSNALLPTVELNENLKAPIKQGDAVGTISYTVDGITYTSNLLASHDVKVSRWFLNLLIIFFILFICWVYLKIKQKKRKNRRLKKNYKNYNKRKIY